MRTYTLIFSGSDPDVPLRVEFDISDPAALFDLAERHVTGRTAELWEGPTLVGQISRSDLGFWCLTEGKSRGALSDEDR